MHEITFAKAIIKELDKISDESKEIIGILIELGELAGVDKESLLSGLQMVRKNNYKIFFKESLIECSCRYYGKAKILERLHDKVIWRCPECDSPLEVVNIKEGNYIKILKIFYK